MLYPIRKRQNVRSVKTLPKSPKDEISIILNQSHNGKTHLHRGINKTIRRIKEKYSWQGLTKEVEILSQKNCHEKFSKKS